MRGREAKVRKKTARKSLLRQIDEERNDETEIERLATEVVPDKLFW